MFVFASWSPLNYFEAVMALLVLLYTVYFMWTVNRTCVRTYERLKSYILFVSWSIEIWDDFLLSSRSLTSSRSHGEWSNSLFLLRSSTRTFIKSWNSQVCPPPSSCSCKSSFKSWCCHLFHSSTSYMSVTTRSITTEPIMRRKSRSFFWECSLLRYITAASSSCYNFVTFRYSSLESAFFFLRATSERLFPFP